MKVHEIICSITACTGVQMQYKCPNGETVWVTFETDIETLSMMLGKVCLDDEIPWIRRTVWG